ADARRKRVATGTTDEESGAAVAAAGDATVVRLLHARGGDGTLDATSRVVLPRGESAGLDLRFELHEFLAVRRPELEAALSGTVRVGGTIGAPDVRGELGVERAVVRPAALPAQSSASQPDPTIVV